MVNKIANKNNFEERLKQLANIETGIKDTSVIRPQKSRSVLITKNSENIVEPYFEIKGRDIIVPTTMKDISVEGDSNSETITFKMNRFIDNEDVSKHSCYIKFLTPDGKGDRYPVFDVRAELDTIYFDWIIDSKVTRISGKVQFAVSFETIKENKLLYNWQTVPTSFNILSGLKVDELITDQYPTLLQQWLSQFEKIADAVNTKVDKVENKQLSTNDFTNDEKTKLSNLENYDDTEVKDLITQAVNTSVEYTNTKTANKVEMVNGKELSSNDYTDDEKVKLSVLKNYDDGEVKNLIANKVDKIGGKQLSTNDFTTAEKEKLAGLDDNHFKGTFTTKEALEVSYPTSKDGDYAYIGNTETDEIIYIWDSTDSIWVPSGNTSIETPATIKTKYESNADTNVYTDAEKAAVGTIQNKLDKTGGVLSGSLELAVVPTLDNHAATKKYIDDLVANSSSGGSEETGATILEKLKTVDGEGSGLDADLLDGKHGEFFADKATVEEIKNKLGGGTITDIIPLTKQSKYFSPRSNSNAYLYNGVYVIIGDCTKWTGNNKEYAPMAAYSTDCETWTFVPAPKEIKDETAEYDDLASCVFSCICKGVLYAIYHAGTNAEPNKLAIYKTTDGKVWAFVSFITEMTEGGILYDVKNDKMTYAYTTGGSTPSYTKRESQNGVTWTTVGTITNIVKGNIAFYYVNECATPFFQTASIGYPYFSVSTDGVTYEKKQVPTFQSMYIKKFSYDEITEQVIATLAKNDGSNAQVLFASKDLDTWVEYIEPVDGGGVPLKNNDLYYVMVGEKLHGSTDGKSFEFISNIEQDTTQYAVNYLFALNGLFLNASSNRTNDIDSFYFKIGRFGSTVSPAEFAKRNLSNVKNADFKAKANEADVLIKPTEATEGNIAIFDADNGVVDSGKGLDELGGSSFSSEWQVVPAPQIGDIEIINAAYFSETHKKFLAGGYSGTLYTSSDGIKWDKQIISGCGLINCFLEVDGILYAYDGTYNVFSTTDLVTWTKKSANTLIAECIYAEQLKLYVAISVPTYGGENVLKYSSDGYLFTNSSFAAGVSDCIEHTNIYWSSEKNLFILSVRRNFSNGYYTTDFLISSDGKYWRLSYPPHHTVLGSLKVAYQVETFDSLLVAVSNFNGSVPSLYSSDGVTWHEYVDAVSGDGILYRRKVMCKTENSLIALTQMHNYGGSFAAILTKKHTSTIKNTKWKLYNFPTAAELGDNSYDKNLCFLLYGNGKLVALPQFKYDGRGGYTYVKNYEGKTESYIDNSAYSGYLTRGQSDDESVGMCANSMGYQTIAKNYQTAMGIRNKLTTNPTLSAPTYGDLLILGNGTATAQSNAFRFTALGKLHCLLEYSASGADYAEYFEWRDGNPEDIDRRGLFVTLENGKIRIANAKDKYILGAISGMPLIIGDDYSDQWKGMYLRDVFGTVITDEYFDEETQQIVKPAKINPDYDPSVPYVPREERKEWGLVGMLGKIVVIDDGTCKVDGYCKVAENGTATTADTDCEKLTEHFANVYGLLTNPINPSSIMEVYRVLERIDDTHIRVLIK